MFVLRRLTENRDVRRTREYICSGVTRTDSRNMRYNSLPSTTVRKSPQRRIFLADSWTQRTLEPFPEAVE